MSRVLVVVGTAVLLLTVSAPPALAHTRASSATNIESTITAAPPLDGVTWRVYPGGEYVEVTNASPVPLIVLGYEGEPYLRVGPDGVERNRNSPATYLNAERYADVAVPPRADADAAPEWERVADAGRYAWHDHRAHWMAPTLPPAVAAAPGVPRDLGSWSVPFSYDGRSFEVHGTLAWKPGPSWWPWLLLGLLLTAPAAIGLQRRGRAVIRCAAVVVAMVALVNLAHVPDEVFALPLPALDVAFGILHNLLFVGAGLAGAALAWRGAAPLLTLGIGSGAVLFHQGLLQVSQLGASQLATMWPPWVTRLLVAVSVGQAVWVGVVVATAARAPSVAAAGDAEPARPADSTVGAR